MVAIDLHPAGTPQARLWGKGWPDGQANQMVAVKWSNGVSPAGGMRHEIAELVEILGNETIRRGYKPKAGWCWGYSNRAIAGTSPAVPSNHSWGLAVDINAPTNPRTDHLVTDMPGWMPDLWNRYGFRWGGDYPPPILRDAMHYEFMGTPAQAAVATFEARTDLLRPDPPKPEPTPPPALTNRENGMVYMIVGNDVTKVYLVSADLTKAVHSSAESAKNFRNGGGVFYDIAPADWALLLTAGLTVH